MVRSPFLLGLASVFVGLTGLLVVVSIAANSPVTVVAALPLGVTAVIMWYHATGRLVSRVRPHADAGTVGSGFGPGGEPGFGAPRGQARADGQDPHDGARERAGRGPFGGYDPGWYVDDDGHHWYIDADGHRWRIGPDGRRSWTVGATGAGGGPIGGTGATASRGRGRRRVDPPGASREAPTWKAACDVLDVALDADQDEIRQAYRAKVKRAHPDTDDGSVEQFKRVTDAYERLTE